MDDFTISPNSSEGSKEKDPKANSKSNLYYILRQKTTKALEALLRCDYEECRKILESCQKSRYTKKDMLEWILTNSKSVDEALEYFKPKDPSSIKTYLENALSS